MSSPIWTPQPGPQTYAIESEADELLYGGARGGGKVQRCLPPLVLAKLMTESPQSTKEEIKMKYEGHVLTPYGFRPISEMKIGTPVCNPDGTIAHVVGFYPQPEQEYYRLTFIDGAVAECGEEHLWGVSVSNSKLGKKRGVASVANVDLPEHVKWNIRYLQQCRVLTTKDIAERHAKAERMRAAGRSCVPWLKVPLCRPCELNGSVGRGHPVPPYTMGVLIGDGTLSASSIVWSKSDTQIAREVQEELRTAGLSYEVRSRDDGMTHGIVGKDPERGYIADMLEAQGVRGLHSWDKFVPAYYKSASKSVRLAIVQGLLDTDGGVDDRGHIEYCTVSERLALDVQYLVRSLGCKATITEKPEPKYIYKGEALTGRKAYRLYVCGADNSLLFRLERKKERCVKYNGGAGDADPYRRIVKIEKIGRFPGACIRVSHPNGLYITNDFVVTHNTSYLLGDFAQQVGLYGPAARGVLFRRTYKQLDEVIFQGQEMYCRTGVAIWQKADMEFKFTGSGATLKLRHLGRLEDCEEYQGHEYSSVMLDELGNFSDFRIVERMRACLRTKVPWVRPTLRATANPGGRLHNEVKRYFVDPAPLGYRVITNDAGKTRVYVPAKVTDNQILLNADPGYLRFLQSITNEALRKAWLEGNWDVVIGSYFGMAWDRERHVVPHIKIANLPAHWEVYRSFDWGSATPYSCLWWTVTSNDIEIQGRTFPKGAIIILRELFGGRTDEENTGLGESSSTVAGKIRRLEADMGRIVQPGPADPSIWAVKDGPSTAETMGAQDVHFVKADNSRLPGWDQVRTRLYGNDHGPMLYVCENCTNLISTLPALVRDEHNWEDIDKDQNDHSVEVTRYICMARKMPPLTASQLRILEERKKQIREPLDKRFGGPSMLVNEDDRGRQRFVEKNNG